MEAYGAVISMTRDLELCLSSEPYVFGSNQLKRVLQTLNSIDNGLTIINFTNNYSTWESYFQDQFTYMVDSLKKDRKPLLQKKRFRRICDLISSMTSLTDKILGVLSLESMRGRIRHMVGSIKKEIEMELNLLTRWREEIPKMYDGFNLMQQLLGDYRPEMMVKFQSEIKELVHEATEYLHFMDDQEIVLVQFDGLVKQSPTVLSDDSEVRISLPLVMGKIALINQRLERIHNHSETTFRQNLDNPASITGNYLRLSNPSRKSPNGNGKLVGLKKELEDMLGCLTRDTLDLKILPVIGMAGIGKTTFVRELYYHPLVMHHFYLHAWITVSQEYQLRAMLLGLLSGVTKSNLSNEIHEMKDEQLMEQLYRSVKGKRYLIVLDDVWDKNALDVLRGVFPNDKNGSRVLLTSRLRDVAIHASPNVPPHCLSFLSFKESWELLCSKIFENETCPEELLPIGKQIAYKCHGLPLALVIVGGLLSKVDQRINLWEEVAQNMGSLVMDDPQHCQSIIALSYSHLPYPLKVCFLYMGIFPEDYEINSQKLISLWIAEGFVLPKEQKLLEEVAKDYLEDLIARSLVMVKKKGSDGKVKICCIHDLMREFCLRESQTEKFLHVIQNHEVVSLKNTEDVWKHYKEILQNELRRLTIHSKARMYMKIRASFPSISTFFCFEALRPTDLKGCFGLYFKVLKILDVMHVHLFKLPEGITLLYSLKHMALTVQQPFLVSSLSGLRHLQTCIVGGEWSGNFCKELLDMAELRHLNVKSRSSPSRHVFLFSGSTFSRNSVLQNLQSLSTIGPSSCTMDVFLCMPNLRKLGVYETEDDSQIVDWFKNLLFLKKLEILKYAFSNPFISSRVRPERFPSWRDLPPNLRKLSLSGTSFPWEDMCQLSMLSKLEVIKLKNYAFSGAVWKLGAIRFNSLKFLQIGSTNLVVWEADGSHFPSLEHLVLRHCRSLKEIPHGIGEAPLLEKIELHCCGDSAVASARQLQEEQENEGNDLLTVYITER